MDNTDEGATMSVRTKGGFIYTTCWHCGRTSPLAVTGEEAARLANGELIQNALAHWTPAQREQMKTGLHPECWDEMFKDLP